ncbi:MAG: hypothetical protein WA581_03520 [Candidatus Acidiferrales bacterium]
MRIGQKVILGSISLVLAVASAVAQAQSNLADLFQKLQNDASPYQYQSYQAARQLVELGKSDNDARAYIALHLPALIEENPHEFPLSWRKAVEIAGDLKIAEACPALKRWVGEPRLGPNERMLADYNDLDIDPAAQALSRIGEPAVPTLVEVLHERQRRAHAKGRYCGFAAHRLTASPGYAPRSGDVRNESWLAKVDSRKLIKT